MKKWMTSKYTMTKSLDGDWNPAFVIHVRLRTFGCGYRMHIDPSIKGYAKALGKVRSLQHYYQRALFQRALFPIITAVEKSSMGG